jgi:Tol biopolymer transport system component/DNA-binding winged helix-turn-helix (wHTH) protein
MTVMSGNGTRMVQFGVFEVDLKGGELRRNGARVRLQEQPFQILAVLLEHPGEIVTRDELQSRLWPADTFVDFDHSLNAAVRRLRDALGDSAENPRFVETVSRRGYRFLAPVSPVSTGDKPAGGMAADEKSAGQNNIASWWFATGAAALVLVGVAVGLFVARERSSPSFFSQPVPERRLTANPTEYPVQGAALSRDGRYLAFSDDTGFYLKQVDTGETHPVTLPEGFKAQPVSWFPDGSHILATSVAGPAEQKALWQLSTIGGTPRELGQQGSEASVSPDGSQIVFLKGAPKSQEVWLMHSDGGQPRKIAGEVGDLFRSPIWSPAGKQIVYLRGMYQPGSLDIAPQIEIFDLASNQRRVVLAQAGLGPAVAWVNDRLAYVISEAPPNQADSNVWWLKLDLKNNKPLGTPRRLTSSPGEVRYLSTSADGKRLAYLKEGWQPDVYVASLEARGTKIGTPRRLTLDERRDFPYAWTPDSKNIFFSSDRDGTFHIFRQSVQAAAPELLVGGPEQSMLPRLTPDGSQIVYLQYHDPFNNTQPVRMMRIPLNGGPPQQVLEATAIGNLQCARLPSTLCIYSQAENRRLTFFSFDPAGGKGREIAHIDDDIPYLYNWTLSPDGSILAMAKKADIAVQPEIRLRSLNDSKERTLKLTGWSGITALDWAADGKTLWVSASTTTGNYGLLNVDLQSRTHPVWEQTKMAVGWAIPSPDGRYLALWQADGNANVWMIENF